MIFEEDYFYYNGAGKTYYKKSQALIENNHHDVKFHYYDHIFDKVNWTIEPEPNLDHFYKARAEQIRNQ